MNNNEWEQFIAKGLKEANATINPPRELLAKIVAAESGRRTNRQPYLNLFSAHKFFIFASVAVFLLLVVSVLPNTLSKVNKHNDTAISSYVLPAKLLADKTEINNNQPLSTDDVDDAVTAILASASDEDSAIKDQVDSEYSSGEDNEAIKNLIQNYDQDQF
jgi:hypothetical protein